MAIKDTLKFITIEEFKEWDGFNEILFDDITAPDSDITTAIIIATSNINYLTGFSIGKIWPEDSDNPSEEIKDIVNNVKIATALYTRYLVSNGDPDYLKGQASISQGGVTYSQSNPEDPYFIPPEVFNYLKDIKEYTSFKGFNVDKLVEPKYNPLGQFMGLGGELNILEQYLMINNILQGYGIKIELVHRPNIRGTEVKFSIDESIIPNINDIKQIQEDIKFIKEQLSLKANLADMLSKFNDVDQELEARVTVDDFNIAINQKQNKLISSGDSQNIKTINGNDLLGQGDIEIDGSVTKESLTNVLTEFNGHYQLKPNATMFQINKSLEKWVDDKITAPQFTEEEALHLKLINNKSIFSKDTADNDYFAGFITPFDIVSDIDQTKKKLHIDYNTWQLFNSDGKSVIFGRDDIRFTDSNNAVTLQYTSDGKLLYGETESLAELINVNDIIGISPIKVGE